MTSKEALEMLFDDLRQFEEHFTGGLTNEDYKRYDIISKDLEILDILKKYLYIDTNSFYCAIKLSLDGIYNTSNKTDFNKIKEWLKETLENLNEGD